MKTQFVTDSHGKKLAVILPIKDYEKLVSDLEEAEDTRLYDEVKARQKETMLFEDYLAQRSQEKNG